MVNYLKQNKGDRQFRWISSVTGDPQVLGHLHQELGRFYGKQDVRQPYQKMLDSIEEISLTEDSVEYSVIKHICDLYPDNVLEVGCANGRTYRHLRGFGYPNVYTGIEISEYLIQQNTQQHSQASWKCAGAYEIPFQDNTFDICFSFYVLEHLVYPENALKEMLRVLKPGGHLVLVFPDFVESGRLASQFLGLSSTNKASEKLRAGKLIDAIISLYDSRLRLPNALKNAVHEIGPFPVNTQPICLSHPLLMSADIDAVYIASKQEIHNWTISNGYQVNYPQGKTGKFKEHSFMEIIKSSN